MGIFALMHHSARCIMQWSLTWKGEIVHWEVRNINTGKNGKVRRALRNFPLIMTPPFYIVRCCLWFFNLNERGRCTAAPQLHSDVYGRSCICICFYQRIPVMLVHQRPPKSKTLLICQPWSSLAFSQFGSLFMVVLVYFRIFLKAALQRNANSHHQVWP